MSSRSAPTILSRQELDEQSFTSADDGLNSLLHNHLASDFFHFQKFKGKDSKGKRSSLSPLTSAYGTQSKLVKTVSKPKVKPPIVLPVPSKKLDLLASPDETQTDKKTYERFYEQAQAFLV